MSEIPLSIDHCRRLFIKETGKTPSEYLTEKRINYAKLLLETRLRNNSISVKEIANHVGFDDPYYFSRVFKKVTGKSPTKW
jgi:two-component system, response regulator YesN